MGKIGLKGIKVFCHIGVSAEERLMGRIFNIDIEVDYPLEKAGETDLLKDTLNYEYLNEIVLEKTKKEYHLMESLAEHIALEISSKHKDVSGMRIRIEKEHPFMKGEIQASYIEWVQ